VSWLAALRTGSVVSGTLLIVVAGTSALALGAGRRGAALAVALVLATFPFKASILDGRADLLATAFTLAGLAAWSRDEQARGWATPAFAAAAFLTRASSITIVLAMLAWSLRRRDRGMLARFALRLAACVAAGVLLSLPVRGPDWYASVLRDVATHATGRSSLLRGPAELLRYLGVCPELSVFVAFSLAALASRGMRDRPVAAFAGASLVLSAYVMTKFASGPNHLVEPAAIAAVLAAVWAAPRLARRSRLPAWALAIAVLGASWRDLVPVLRHGADAANRRAQVIERVRAEPGDVLTEDALLSLAAGRRPAVSDMDALRAMALGGDPRALGVVDQLATGRFALVVLNGDLETSASWYRSIGFTDRTIPPLRARYREAEVVDDYHLYRAQAPAARHE